MKRLCAAILANPLIGLLFGLAAGTTTYHLLNALNLL
jgi:hypothetical protein